MAEGEKKSFFFNIGRLKIAFISKAREKMP
jgi:hypothetical protein